MPLNAEMFLGAESKWGHFGHMVIYGVASSV